MRVLIYYEVKKLFGNRMVLIMLVLFSFLNFMRIYSNYQNTIQKEKRYFNAYFEIYNQVSGEWNTDKIQYVIAEYEKANAIVQAGDFATEPNQPGTHTGYIFGDLGLFEQIKNEMESLYKYEQSMDELIQRASDNATFYKEKGNIYQQKVNEKIVTAYSNRKVNAFYDTMGIREYLKYDFSVLFITILTVLMLSPIFAREHEIEMYGLLKLTSQFRSLTICKVLAGGIAVCMIGSFFFLQDFLSFSVLYHIKGLSQPIYSLPDYYYSPLNISIGGYLFLNAALKILCFLTIGGICMAISAAVKNEVIPFCVSFVIALGLFLADAFFHQSTASTLNPITLSKSSRLFASFDVVKVIGTPVYRFVIPILFGLLACCILSIVITLILIISQSERKHSIYQKQQLHNTGGDQYEI